jgi:hypothetical protein
MGVEVPLKTENVSLLLEVGELLNRYLELGLDCKQNVRLQCAWQTPAYLRKVKQTTCSQLVGVEGESSLGLRHPPIRLLSYSPVSGDR